MTCIVGIKHEGGVILGGDSAGVSDFDLTVRSDPKVFYIHPVLAIGFTSSYRMGQLLRYQLPKYLDSHVTPKDVDDSFEWMVTVFAEGCRKVFADGGVNKRDNDVDRGGSFLVALAGDLFRIDSDYQVGVAACGYEAIGCGDNYALGALHATIGRQKDSRMAAALGAATAHSAGVCAPFVFAHTRPLKEAKP